MSIIGFPSDKTVRLMHKTREGGFANVSIYRPGGILAMLCETYCSSNTDNQINLHIPKTHMTDISWHRRSVFFIFFSVSLLPDMIVSLIERRGCSSTASAHVGDIWDVVTPLNRSD